MALPGSARLVAERLANPLGLPLMIADVRQVTDLLGPSAAAPGDSFVISAARHPFRRPSAAP